MPIVLLFVSMRRMRRKLGIARHNPYSAAQLKNKSFEIETIHHQQPSQMEAYISDFSQKRLGLSVNEMIRDHNDHHTTITSSQYILWTFLTMHAHKENNNSMRLNHVGSAWLRKEIGVGIAHSPSRDMPSMQNKPTEQGMSKRYHIEYSSYGDSCMMHYAQPGTIHIWLYVTCITHHTTITPRDIQERRRR